MALLGAHCLQCQYPHCLQPYDAKVLIKGAQCSKADNRFISLSDDASHDTEHSCVLQYSSPRVQTHTFSRCVVLAATLTSVITRSLHLSAIMFGLTTAVEFNTHKQWVRC